MKPRIDVFVVVIIFSIFIFAAIGRAETILVQDGTSQIDVGFVLPMYSLLVGTIDSFSNGTKILTSERVANQFKDVFGPFSVDGDVYVRSRGGGWMRATFRRPKDADEHLQFLENKNLFRSETVGGIELLPPFFGQLPPDEREKILFIIVFRAGGTRIALYPMSGASAGNFKEAWIRVAGS